MLQNRKARWLGAIAMAGGIALLSMSDTAPIQTAQAEVKRAAVHSDEMGFVLSDISYVLGPDADKMGGCPSGLTQLARRTAANASGAAGQSRIAGAPGAQPAAAARPTGAQDSRSAAAGRLAGTGLAGGGERMARDRRASVCAMPLEAGPDPLTRTVVGRDIALDGLDLDGQDSRAGGKAAAGTCAHDDFRSTSGRGGIDNQFWRAVGCTAGFQTTGSKNGFGGEMLTGAWGILVHLKGVDDLVNDDHVEVGIHANADPIQLSTKREAVSFASYSVDPNPRFQARTRGRIVDGVLTTDPVNVRFHHTVNNIWLERPIDAARLRITFTKEGGIEGILAGYSDIDSLFDYVVGMRSGKNADGTPKDPTAIVRSAAGSSGSAGMTCNGFYHSLMQLADGQRDPATGKCRGISIQYRIKASPAFVVAAQRTTLSGRSK
jgi:hypothetical protein